MKPDVLAILLMVKIFLQCKKNLSVVSGEESCNFRFSVSSFMFFVCDDRKMQLSPTLFNIQATTSLRSFAGRHLYNRGYNQILFPLEMNLNMPLLVGC